MSTETRHRKTGRNTSRAAARLAEGNVSEKHRSVLQCFWRDHFLTDLDLAQLMNDVFRSTYRTRRAELTEAGLIEQGGRALQLDSTRVVWRLTADGHTLCKRLFGDAA